MKITLKYERRRFGNDDDLSDYSANVSRSPGGLEVQVGFNHAMSRGGMYSDSSDVTGFTISMSPADARKLATAILWQLENPAGGPISLAFGRAVKGD